HDVGTDAATGESRPQGDRVAAVSVRAHEFGVDEHDRQAVSHRASPPGTRCTSRARRGRPRAVPSRAHARRARCPHPDLGPSRRPATSPTVGRRDGAGAGWTASTAAAAIANAALLTLAEPGREGVSVSDVPPGSARVDSGAWTGSSVVLGEDAVRRVTR